MDLMTAENPLLVCCCLWLLIDILIDCNFNVSSSADKMILSTEVTVKKKRNMPENIL